MVGVTWQGNFMWQVRLWTYSERRSCNLNMANLIQGGSHVTSQEDPVAEMHCFVLVIKWCRLVVCASAFTQTIKHPCLVTDSKDRVTQCPTYMGGMHVCMCVCVWVCVLI